MEDSKTLRTFIAIELPEEIQKKLGEFSDSVKNPNDRITWVFPKNIHLTLKFIGDVPASDIDSIKNIIIDVAGGYGSFEASIKGTGVFPSERNPRVVWIGVDSGKDKIKDIYTELEERLVSIGIPKEERGYTPHITLARVKYIKDIKGFAGIISKYKENLFGSLSVDGISLIKSTLTPKGAVYEVLYSIPLAGRGDYARDNSQGKG